MNPTEIDCKTACVNGGVLGDDRPNQEYRQQASQFIHETLWTICCRSQMRQLEKMAAAPKWVFPEDGIQPE